ncbi:S-adenosyl-L-methionine-dependent methyltransferase [Coniochaeta ligniaria NRRL 30616]|uniref:S-adenosyl-L-methionine-dependent methyltransferase n=1 Tax=Coniochaeta ligniaria NRRL 30616 TaxID=1408157 RepID=A0A1J7JFC1_9PEZI|nr:S-adenosyl-L-methionine-dependent methyltransferase [Coniochaeta ligniaria NRRL 30616]
MTSANNARFNAEAAAWDSNPTVVLASDLARKAILDRLPGPDTTSRLDVLEIGCGTGILSLALAPSFRSVTAVDAAEGMIAALEAKLNAENCTTKNVRPVCALLEDPGDERIRPDAAAASRLDGSKRLEPRRFDLVVSHLVLHHIPDLLSVLQTMFGCLKRGGLIMLTDFEDFGPQARRFHPETKMAGVERHGIKRTDMEALLLRAGFVDVRVETAFKMDKTVETEPGSGVKGPTMTFPFLICIGKKPTCPT